MLPLQPRNPSDSAARRWVRQDFRMRRKLFLEEVAKLAVDGPVHRIDVRRARCFKDSIDKFAGMCSCRCMPCTYAIAIMYESAFCGSRHTEAAGTVWVGCYAVLCFPSTVVGFM